MIVLSYFKNNEFITKEFKSEKKAYKFVTRKRITTFLLNGWWHFYIGEEVKHAWKRNQTPSHC